MAETKELTKANIPSGSLDATDKIVYLDDTSGMKGATVTEVQALMNQNSQWTATLQPGEDAATSFTHGLFVFACSNTPGICVAAWDRGNEAWDTPLANQRSNIYGCTDSTSLKFYVNSAVSNAIRVKNNFATSMYVAITKLNY